MLFSSDELLQHPLVQAPTVNEKTLANVHYLGELCLRHHGNNVAFESVLFCRVLDVQRSVKGEMKVPLMGIQNQDHTLKRSLCFALVHMLQLKCYFLSEKKISYLLLNWSRHKRFVWLSSLEYSSIILLTIELLYNPAPPHQIWSVVDCNKNGDSIWLGARW